MAADANLVSGYNSLMAEFLVQPNWDGLSYNLAELGAAVYVRRYDPKNPHVLVAFGRRDKGRGIAQWGSVEAIWRAISDTTGGMITAETAEATGVKLGVNELLGLDMKVEGAPVTTTTMDSIRAVVDYVGVNLVR